MIFSHGKSDARGVLIDFREAVKYKIKARYVEKMADNVPNVLIGNNSVILVNYYAPNAKSDQLKVLDELVHIFNQLQISENTTFIWGGISICFLTSIWMQIEAPLNSKLSHFPNFFL